MNHHRHSRHLSYQNDRNMDRVHTIGHLETLCSTLGLPADILPGCPIITMRGANCIHIENHEKLLEYTKDLIRISARTYHVCIDGNEMIICSCSKDEIDCRGIFHTIRYVFSPDTKGQKQV